MVFERWRKPTKSANDALIILKNRLDQASYEEDRIETLQKLYGHAISHPSEEMIDICVGSIVKSLTVTEDKTYQLAIFHSLYLYSNFLIETLTSEPEHARIILGCGPHFLSSIIRVLNSEKLCQFLSQDDSVSNALKNLVKEGFFFEFCKLFSGCFANNHIIKETLVFEGIFEELLEKRHKYDVLKEPLTLLLSNSEKNQRYFVDSGLYKQLLNNELAFDIFPILLDPSSKYSEINQKKIFSINLLQIALVKKKYAFVYSLIRENEENFKCFVECCLKIEDLLADCDNSLDAFRIADLIHRKTTINLTGTTSFRINALLFDQEHDDCDKKLLGVLESRNLCLDALIYLIFSRRSIDDVIEYLNEAEYIEPINSMCILIKITFGKEVLLTPAQIRSRLERLRLYLLSETPSSDSIIESLVETITQILIQVAPKFERISYNYGNKRTTETDSKVETAESQNEQKAISTENKIIDGVNNKIKDLFSKFKTDRQSYDL